MSSQHPDSVIGRAALEAVASPARLEILSALGEGPKTTRDLARELGRSRQSLYYHLGLLEEGGLVAVDPPAEGERERSFRLRRERLAVGAERDSAEDRAAATKAIRAVLRLTARETSEALADPATRLDASPRELVAIRGKARLTEAELVRVNELVDELESLLRGATGGPREVPLYAVTLVLTPAREAGEAEPDPEES